MFLPLDRFCNNIKLSVFIFLPFNIGVLCCVPFLYFLAVYIHVFHAEAYILLKEQSAP